MASAVGTRNRFLLAFLGLGAVLGAAIGLFVLFVQRPAPPPPPPWSLWKPGTTSAATRAAEIARHVGEEYRLPSGNRLVHVIVGAPGSANAIKAIALSAKAQPKAASDFTLFDPRQSMMYILCGAGRSCAIREGKASTYRGAILRREALELALYTFSYVKQTKSVVVFFPPKKGQKLAFALFFVRSEFDSELKQPLRRTLSAPVPIRTLPGELNSAERARIDDLTGRRVFRFEIDQSRSGGTILVLAPPVPGR